MSGEQALTIRFDDGKEPSALRTIGEVAKALGIRQHVLRYWEEQFPTLKPLKRSGGRRYYRPEDVALIARIDSLVHREGYTLRGARLAIEGKVASSAAREVAVQTSTVSSGSGGMLAELRAIRAGLAAALAAS